MARIIGLTFEEPAKVSAEEPKPEVEAPAEEPKKSTKKGK